MDIRRLASLVGATAIHRGRLLDRVGHRVPRPAPRLRARPRPAPRPVPPQRRGERRGDCTVGVSWNNFQQPRWAAHDEPNMKGTVEAGGGTYISADANLSTEQQVDRRRHLISKGAKVLILLAQDTKAVLPAIQKAKDAGIPVIAYDRLIEDPSILYITFDNVARRQGRGRRDPREGPEGQLRPDQGRPGRPERLHVPAAGLGRGRPQGQGRLRRHQAPQRA